MKNAKKGLRERGWRNFMNVLVHQPNGNNKYP